MPTQRTAIENPAQAAQAVLQQCAEFLEALPDDAYARSSPILMGSTIGQHVRHGLDHFAAALTCVDGETIDYDRRVRGGAVETNRAEALSRIAALRSAVSGLDDRALAETVTVRVMLSGDGAEAELSSTLARELAFAAHHAIHHHAMIASIAKGFDIDAPEGFGKAPSTINHESVVRSA